MSGSATAQTLEAAPSGVVAEIVLWYLSLAKPSWQPPDWVFAPAWAIIYALLATATVWAWNDAPDRTARRKLVALVASNLALNFLWAALFFGLRRPDWALAELIVLWASILLLILVLRRFSPRAAWLLVPYLAWVTFAGALNAAVVVLN